MKLPTPLVPLAQYDDNLYAKIEYLHPSGSIKHRSIPNFLKAMKDSGVLNCDQQVVIRSAGSAAVTTAWAGANLGLSVIAVLPPTVTRNILILLQWLGATCHQVHRDTATTMMEQFNKSPDSYVVAQTTEEKLIDHYRPVACEILDELGTVSAITVGIGTGLSSMGIAREVADKLPDCQVYGVEPQEAAIASGKPWQAHNIPGLAPPIAQPLLDTSMLSGIETVLSDEAWHYSQHVAKEAGLMLGPSSGATIAAALNLRKRGVVGPIVAICACSIYQYLDSISI